MPLVLSDESFTLALRKRIQKTRFLNRLSRLRSHKALHRKLAFLWVFLIFLEIACPIFECQIFSESFPENITEVSRRISHTNIPDFSATVSSGNKEFHEISSAAEYDSVTDQSSMPGDCNDECLCHVTPIQGLSFVVPKAQLLTEISRIKNKFQPTGNLPPPYQPPQFS